MRSILFQQIKKAVAEDPNVFFLTADVGFNLVESMFEQFPDRAMNIGVAEQNLVGIAAGLCNLGFKPIVYSYTNFLAERAFEQIRNDICVHHYAAIFVGTTTGFDNGILGPTHLSLDDMAGLKALPNLRIYSPSTSESMGLVIKEALASGEASFIRFTKSELSEGKEVAAVNRFMVKNQNAPVLLVSHGKMAQNCFKAAALNESFSLFAMDRIKPFDGEHMRKLSQEYKKIVVVEDSFKSAGLYVSISQFVVENRITQAEIISLSPREFYDERIGSAEYFEDKNGLSPEKIAGFIQSILGR
jgi:transketolase